MDTEDDGAKKQMEVEVEAGATSQAPPQMTIEAEEEVKQMEVEATSSGRVPPQTTCLGVRAELKSVAESIVDYVGSNLIPTASENKIE